MTVADKQNYLSVEVIKSSKNSKLNDLTRLKIVLNIVNNMLVLFLKE